MKQIHKSSWLGILGLLALSAPVVAASSTSIREMKSFGGETERVSAEVAPKVVQIATQSLRVATAGDPRPTGVLVAEHGRGSGFFVTSDGYIITNAHVVADAARIRVAVPADSAREYSARVVGTDTDNDLALLKVDVQGVAFFDLTRDTAPRQGQLAMAFGSPRGLAQSASLGLISAVDRQLDPDDPRTYLQTDASINPGNSGGPLVDLEGGLLGINTMILSQSGGSEGLGFAVPLEAIRRSYAALRADGIVSRPRLGIQPRSLTTELIAGLGLKVRQGVLVEDVDPFGPAADAGLLPGDVLLSLGAELIHDIRDLYRAECALAAGAPAAVAVMRGRDARFQSITPRAARSTPAAPSVGSVTEKDNLVFRLGLYGATLTPAEASTLSGLRQRSGVLVLALAGIGPAGDNAFEPGDVLHSLNGTAVDSVEALRKLLETIPEGAPIVLQIERAGALSYVTPGTQSDNDPHVRKTAAGRVNTSVRTLRY